MDHALVAFQGKINGLFEGFWRDFDLPMFGRAEQGRGHTPAVQVDIVAVVPRSDVNML